MSKDYKDQHTEVGRRIKELRIEAGYTSHETFANDHSFSRRNYWRIENGGDFKFNTLLRILEIHNVSLEKFFSEME
ncbi:helix-turn-helix domain-containing protein [Flagellimonas pacifica]|nr:helix-turn-helix transcriptional regulator [Allomuricauda parva]